MIEKEKEVADFLGANIKYNLMLGDNMNSLDELQDNSIDAIITDPPYALISIKKRFGKEGSAPAKYGTDGVFQRASKGFMGKEWDAAVPSVELWKKVYRVLKPGGHILSFGGTRTYHRMVVNCEDAGFEVRDCISWLYGSGFPKSLNIGKAVDKIEENERVELGDNPNDRTSHGKNNLSFCHSTGGKLSKGTSAFEGFGSALKPAQELILLARKPLSEGTIADNVLKWGTGGLNIDGCRIGTDGGTKRDGQSDQVTQTNTELSPTASLNRTGHNIIKLDDGRFPANIILDEEAAKLLDEQSGISKSEKMILKLPKTSSFTGLKKGVTDYNRFTERGHNDQGGASRFFYCAKVSKKERNLGLSGINNHSTVKPVKLMSYLIKLITPPNGVILDPFMGSGSTGIAALLEGFNFIGMEMEPDYMKIAEARIAAYEKYK